MGSLSPSSKLATATVAPSIPSVTVRNLELLPELASLTVISQWPCPQFPYWPFWRYLASYSCLASRCHSPPWTELSTTTAGRSAGCTDRYRRATKQTVSGTAILTSMPAPKAFSSGAGTGDTPSGWVPLPTSTGVAASARGTGLDLTSTLASATATGSAEN